MSKVVFKNFYLVNKLPTGLVLKAGYISIKQGSFVKILESDLEHQDVLDAVNRGWAEVHSEEPDVSDLVKAPELVVEHEGYQGMTAEELKASKTPEKKSTATSESIGKNTDVVEKVSEAAASQIGQTAEEANGVAETEKAKRGRKAAAE
jgi:hypothetical protein